VNCRSRITVDAYYRDGTSEADAAIVQAINGAERFTDSLDDVVLMVPNMCGGTRKMPVGSWIYRVGDGWTTTSDSAFRRKYEVPGGAIWLLMEPGGEAPTILAAYTDPDVAAATESLLTEHTSYLWLEEVTTIQPAPPRVVERLWMACYLTPDGAIWAGASRPAPYTETYQEYLTDPEQVSMHPPVIVEHSRSVYGRPDDLISDGKVYIKAEGTDMDAVRAAFDAEVRLVRALLAAGELR
jgi:hypothetical protein